MLSLKDKKDLALESMDALFKLYPFNGNDNKVKVIMNFWESMTIKPLTKKGYYEHIEKLIAHLKKEHHSWN